MRFNFRIKMKIGKYDITYFGMIAFTQTLEGITSRVVGREGYHYPLFDIEGCSLEQAENELMKLQVSYGLSNIFITSDIEESFRTWCFCEVRFTDYIRMQLDLLDAGLLDYNFFWWTVNKGKGTLRKPNCNKKDRKKQEPISRLYSYSVPFPKKFEEVIYDTGIEKRGLTVFLGEKGRVIHG